jgi:hypothetical protein
MEVVMKKALSFVVLIPFFLIHCGGEVGGGETDPFVEEEAEATSENFPKVKNDAITGGGGNIAVDAGYASNGTTISVPTGFVISQCKFTAAAATIDGDAISIFVSVDTTSDPTAARVVCEKVVQERVEIPPEANDCAAAFTMICVK